MYFAKTLFVYASLVASTIAQSSSSRIAFTVLPSSMTAGQDITLHWGGGDGSPVTLTLQQGTTSDLTTVSLVKGDATGNEYTWHVPTSLPNASNYAFRIQQGDTEPNYTGMITLTGGSASSASASSTAASSATSKSGSATTTKSSYGSAGSGSSKSSSASQNSTVVATASANATTSVLAGTAASASGTGASIARNTTLSKATLSATSSAALTTSSNPSVGGSGGTPTGSTTAPSPSKTGGAAALAASNFALLVCAIAGVIYLG